MARGNDSQFDNLKLFFLKVKGLKAGETIHMIQEQSNGKGVKPTLLVKENGDPDTIRNISGVLEGVFIRENEYQGDTIRELKVVLADEAAQERYIVGVGMNSISRDIMNRLISGNLKGKVIEISVYMNDKGYPAVSVKANGERVDWKYSIDDLKPLVVENTVVKKGKQSVERDHYAVEQKLIDELLVMYPQKTAPTAAPQRQEPEAVSAEPTHKRSGRSKKMDEAPVAAGEENDDLPF